jgi:putative nucleotidyltransferase with HDIG domain
MQDLIHAIEHFEKYENIHYGIHGKSHATRVLLFANMLANMCRDKNPNLKVITVAALLHDIGRENDGKDPEHAKRSAVIAQEFLEQHDFDIDVEAVKNVINYHTNPDDFKDTIEAKIVSDADKLDRLRFSRFNLNTDFFSLPEYSNSLIHIADMVNLNSSNKWLSTQHNEFKTIVMSQETICKLFEYNNDDGPVFSNIGWLCRILNDYLAGFMFKATRELSIYVSHDLANEIWSESFDKFGSAPKDLVNEAKKSFKYLKKLYTQS